MRPPRWTLIGLLTAITFDGATRPVESCHGLVGGAAMRGATRDWAAGALLRRVSASERSAADPTLLAALQPQRGCSLQPSVARHSRATLGYDSTMKTTLKELCRGDKCNREIRKIREQNSGFYFRVVRVVRG